ncbi:MAG: amino acid ABC transporter permease [Acidimicrobiales bacterium]
MSSQVPDTEAAAAPQGPPVANDSAAEWAKQNLFSTPGNAITTLIIGAISVALAVFGIQWIVDADFEIVRTNLRLFMIGQFPKDELWRPWASGYVVLTAIGFVSGAMAHNAYDKAVEQELPAHKASWWELIRRFWAIIAVVIFFVSFARTLLPYLGVVVGFVIIYIARELGWRLNAAIRARAIYVGAALGIISMIILAGTSVLGGMTLGLIAFWWASSEMSRRDLPRGGSGTAQRWGIPLLVAVAVFIIEVSIPFDGFGWEDWGGLHITLFTTVLGISLGMPVGILLALGRRSNLPVLKTASVLYIEFIRGVPLISLLLFSNLMLPLFLPIDFERPADLTLAIVVITGFSAAYIAEIVRGGLQAVPKGQTEAAQAMGLSASAVQRLIVLPQALRAVIPAMVGQFIALFKDTSLLSIIGILEFLRVSDVANAQPQFVGKGLASVTYLFVAIGYWAFAYTMSKESRRLETKLGVGVR